MSRRDLGDDAVTLWTRRLTAERNALAAVALHPAKLWPLMAANDCTLATFDFPIYRGVFVVFDDSHHFGSLHCGKLAVTFARTCGLNTDHVIQLFDLYPPSEAHAVYRIRQLVTLTKIIDTAAAHLAKARALVAAGIDVAERTAA